MSAPRGLERDPDWLKAAYDRERYLSRREERIAQVQARREEAKAKVREMKARPCADCGETYPPCVMEFDHLPGTEKLGTISTMVHSMAWDAVLVEIEKCEVVCANCHRIRTHITRKVDDFEDYVA